MRYGLISNLRRSWSKIGTRTIIDTQQSYANRYLFSAVSPLSGDSFHLAGFEEMDTANTRFFLLELKKKHPDIHVIVVWDGAPCHRPQILHDIEGMTIICLPPYSPELNPAERFFEELRKATANQVFSTLHTYEEVIDERLRTIVSDYEGMKRLLGYDWILKQTE